MMRKLVILGIILIPITVSAVWWNPFTWNDNKVEPETEVVFGAQQSFSPTILPLRDSEFELGTSSRAWLRGTFDELCLTADSCETAWPSGGSGSSEWTDEGGYLRPNETEGVIVSASSTISDISSTNSTSTNATSTNLNTTNLKVSGLGTARIPYISTGGLFVTSAGLQFDDTLSKITVTNLQTTNSTSTSATTTNLHISNFLNFNSVVGDEWSDFCVSITGSSDLCDGSDDGGSGSSLHVDGTGFVYPQTGDYHSAPKYVATSTTEDSTFVRLTATNATTTNATSTTFSVSTAFDFLGTIFTDLTSFLFETELDSEAELESQLTDVTNVFTNNDGALDDDDLSDNTTTDLAEGTNLYFTDARVQSELLDGNNAIFGNATSTNFAITGLTDAILKVTGAGSVIEAVSGTDYEVPLTFGDALTRTGNDIDFDGGATPGGDLGGTWASPSVNDDSHNHTGATISGIDISDDTNLTAGDALTITGDTIDFDGGATPGGSLGGTWASPTIDDLFLLLAGDSSSGNYTWTGSNDFGGATFLEIPNGTAPTANDVGELAHDTTDNQLILDDFVVGKATEKIWSVTVASTSPAFISGGLIPVPVQLDGYTITAIRCYVVSGTSKVVAVEDASANSSEDITCGTTLTSDDGSITNATYTAGELSNIDFGATSGAVDYVTISVFGTWTRE